MKFDLLDAIRIMKHNFGHDGEILIGSDESGVKVRMRAFKNNDFHNYQFIISHDQIIDSYLEVMNMHFSQGITEINDLIKISNNQE